MPKYTLKSLAGGAAFLLGLVSVAGAKSEMMSAADIQNEIIGVELMVRDTSWHPRAHIVAPLIYRADGTVSMKIQREQLDGSWRLSGNKMCTSFPDQREGRYRCYYIYRGSGNNYWSSHGWRSWKR